MKRKSKLVRALGKMIASIVGAAQYRAYVESCLGQMQVGINRSKVSFQGIADMSRFRRIRRSIVS